MIFQAETQAKIFLLNWAPELPLDPEEPLRRGDQAGQHGEPDAGPGAAAGLERRQHRHLRRRHPLQPHLQQPEEQGGRLPGRRHRGTRADHRFSGRQVRTEKLAGLPAYSYSAGTAKSVTLSHDVHYNEIIFWNKKLSL